MENCPSCGREVPSIFEHVAIDDCENKTDSEIARMLLAEAEQRVSEALEARASARTNFEAAVLADACEKPHEWSGKKVKRAITQRGGMKTNFYSDGYNPDRQVKQTGIVMLQGGRRMPYRNHIPEVGEWFVLSASGQTAYKLTDDWQLA